MAPGFPPAVRKIPLIARHFILCEEKPESVRAPPTVAGKELPPHRLVVEGKSESDEEPP
jgi:hypothetical protein